MASAEVFNLTTTNNLTAANLSDNNTIEQESNNNNSTSKVQAATKLLSSSSAIIPSVVSQTTLINTFEAGATPDIIKTDKEVTDTTITMYADTFESAVDPRDGPLEESGSMDGGNDQECKICKRKYNSPRVLSCLHVFCESCLDMMLIDETGDSAKLNCAIECPTCEQLTKVGNKGAASLPCDYISTNILDLNTVEPGMLACTSCKSKENAISRCNDCANFLCASCDNAHKYMRCFENHHVIVLDELQKSSEKVAIHKPLFCSTHTSENLKYYCRICQIPVCQDCLLAEHKGDDHRYEMIAEAEHRIRIEMESLVKNAKAKVTKCDDAANNLSTSLTELQSQHDTAHEMIETVYKKLKAQLDKYRDDALKELERLHSERELTIMDLLHSVENTVVKIESACKFTNRVLDHANGPELLCLKKMISTQLTNLISNLPKSDINMSLEFESNYEKFEQLGKDSFGKFRTEASPPSPKESTPPPTLPGMPPVLAPKSTSQSASNSQGTLTGSVTASSPISLPTSMQSSFDGDMNTLGNNYILPMNVLGHDSPTSVASAILPPPNANIITPPPSVATPVGSSTMSGLSSIAEYNLQQLANLAENNMNDHMADSMMQQVDQSQQNTQFTIADLISGDQRALNNLQALAKLNDITNNQLLGVRGPSPGMDSNLLTDFVGMPSSASSITDINDFGMQNFQQGVGVRGRTKASSMQIRCKFGSLGTCKGQFNSPHGFCLGVEEEIIVADTNNHRIEVFEKNGTFKFQFGVPGKEEGQLWYPRKVAVMKTNSKFVVCDRGNERSRMQIFTKNGHFIKKIAIRYIDIVAGLAVTSQGHIVAVDSVSPTVFIISEDGDLVHWFDCSDYMREPSDIAINGNDFYVCDFKGHCVAVFKDDGKFQYRIGNEKITCFPNGIDISDAGDILIGDSHGNRFHVACFSRDGVLQSEFECPYVKVSRCCGLKITSEGYVVTLAKNNHHVLVLNTLYIQ